jgi:hypothetical protein
MALTDTQIKKIKTKDKPYKSATVAVCRNTHLGSVKRLGLSSSNLAWFVTQASVLQGTSPGSTHSKTR